jgi:uncharacterized protein (DUF2147 family)
MRKILLIAALMISTSAVAHAGDSWSFNVNGQRVRIERPRNCTSLSCLNIVAPGLSNSNSDDSSSSTANTTPVAPAQNQAVATAPVQQAPVQQAPIQQAPIATAPVAPAQVAAPVATIPPLPTQTTTAPAASNITSLPAPVDANAQPQQTAAAPVTNQVATVTPAPVQQPIQQVAPQQQVAAIAPTAPAAVANGPVGMWMTEKNEGKVHVVECGTNICGYAVDKKTGADGAQVLINMKPSGDSWHGRIHDTRSGGTYDSTIAMRGNDKMRVQGCAFGGMFCGGQTWSRTN